MPEVVSKPAHARRSVSLIQRCQVHKKRNILGHLPEERHATISRVLDQAYLETDSETLARRQLERLARSLEQSDPGAAASVWEGLDETLTVKRLEVSGALYLTLRSTNPIENLNGSVAHHTRNVKRWRDGLMVQRWVAMSLAEAEKKFRRIRGFREMNHLVAKLDEHQRHLELDNEEAIA